MTDNSGYGDDLASTAGYTSCSAHAAFFPKGVACPLCETERLAGIKTFVPDEKYFSESVAKAKFGDTSPSANDRQVGGEHYKKHGSTGEQHWDRVARIGMDPFQANITKYVERWQDKGGLQDLEKARHYLDKYIELVKAGYRQSS